MQYLNSKNLTGIICRTLDHVDPRVVSHGKRVTYLFLQMLKEQGGFTDRELRDLCMVGILHDIGAYKTEEISNMVDFETEDMWKHSAYGYLFIRELSPLRQYAPAILCHHASNRMLEELNFSEDRLVRFLRLADRIDIYVYVEQRKGILDYLKNEVNNKFSPEIIDVFLKAEQNCHIFDKIDFEDYWQEVLDVLDRCPFTPEEIDTYLKMLVFAIDFRSKYTVIHTIMTTELSVELAHYLGMDEENVEQVRYGAMLHDLGKIGIPVEILEYPGKLSPQAIKVMRTHVDLTKDILNNEIDPVIVDIALRHHEKLDGSGYPKGLTGKELTRGEKIVAIADIVSALSGERSYKVAFGREKIEQIMRESAALQQLDSKIIGLMIQRFNDIMESVRIRTEPILSIYQNLETEYGYLLKQLTETAKRS